ncbi:MAG: hypothetical protein IID17_14465 [Nitrospinae bacterium]|nr:hypothetical protein [Nitrospinota bacterium]
MTEWIGKSADFLDQVAVRFKRGSLPGAYRDVFDSPAGQIVLANLVREGGMMITHGGDADAVLQFEEGKRFMVLHILKMLRLKPRELQQIADMEAIDD